MRRASRALTRRDALVVLFGAPTAAASGEMTGIGWVCIRPSSAIATPPAASIPSRGYPSHHVETGDRQSLELLPAVEGTQLEQHGGAGDDRTRLAEQSDRGGH